MDAIRPDLADLLDNLHDGLYFVDRERRITYWNAAAKRITGFSADEVVGRYCFDNLLAHISASGCSLCQGHCPLAATMDDGQPKQADVFLRHKAGHRVPVWVRASPLRDAQGAIIGAVELFTDTSSRASLREKVAELERLALLDPLTQLPNRRYLDSEIGSRLNAFEQAGVPVGLLMIDIDFFKRFNDLHGHDVGDLALKSVAETMVAAVRPFDTLGRWGGEEFLGIFPNTTAPVLAGIAERLCVLVRASCVRTNAEPLHITVSVGGAISRPGDIAATLLKRADALLYRSKEEGRDRSTVE